MRKYLYPRELRVGRWYKWADSATGERDVIYMLIVSRTERVMRGRYCRSSLEWKGWFHHMWSHQSLDLPFGPYWTVSCVPTQRERNMIKLNYMKWLISGKE